MNLSEQIKNYQPFNEQEVQDKKTLLALIKEKGLENLLTRENSLAHLTASAWVVNADHQKVLMAYHNLYDSWSWLGGHADGQADLLAVALKEVTEESGLTKLQPILNEIFSLEILTVDGHEKNGVYLSSHLHLNVTYLIEASEEEPLTIKPDENSQVAWFLRDQAVAASSEPWFQTRIYTKLNQKLASYFEKNN
ncbi:MAG: NUDIX hydrolase [Enterococcus sp.]|nr:NUDIX hydrolase [Enterococcus sp.]